MIRWTWAFLDRPRESFDACVRFWSTVTGTTPSSRRGEHGEFLTLLPDPGTGASPAVKMQAVGGPGGTHLDFDVDDIPAARAAALRLGAAVVADHPDHTVLRSPGGLSFCLTPATPGPLALPTAVAAPDGTRSRLDQICLDIGPSGHAAEVAFWQALTGWEFVAGRLPEFSRLRAAAPMAHQLLLQRVGDERPVAAHIDLSCDDIEAGAAWHESLGATVLARFEHWIVLSDPAGVAYCVTGRDPNGV
ncbi:MAG TPA: VOC family protein [Nocardia sp.]|uniref:VOC family protein n=1 Tax=Nocardia TaxID=1817 RepID=UPI002458EBBF|nr:MULTISPECIES: VOC family protein [Nocardia]HLS78101.1 VOC family protein [Nocardia sp.]